MIPDESTPSLVDGEPIHSTGVPDVISYAAVTISPTSTPVPDFDDYNVNRVPIVESTPPQFPKVDDLLTTQGHVQTDKTTVSASTMEDMSPSQATHGAAAITTATEATEVFSDVTPSPTDSIATRTSSEAESAAVSEETEASAPSTVAHEGTTPSSHRELGVSGATPTIVKSDSEVSQTMLSVVQVSSSPTTELHTDTDRDETTEGNWSTSAAASAVQATTSSFSQTGASPTSDSTTTTTIREDSAHETQTLMGAFTTTLNPSMMSGPDSAEERISIEMAPVTQASPETPPAHATVEISDSTVKATSQMPSVSFTSDALSRPDEDGSGVQTPNMFTTVPALSHERTDFSKDRRLFRFKSYRYTR